jgi:hypothetical protein
MDVWVYFIGYVGNLSWALKAQDTNDSLFAIHPGFRDRDIFSEAAAHLLQEANELKEDLNIHFEAPAGIILSKNAKPAIMKELTPQEQLRLFNCIEKEWVKKLHVT